jgi:predicted RNA-binding protein with RPS1 domain
MEANPVATEITNIHDVNEIKRKMHFTGKVMKITLAGAVVDIGLPIPGVVHISQISKDPINRVEDALHEGQEVELWVRRVFPKKDRIELTMIKPLDMEWRDLDKDLVLKGKVVRLEKFGVFVDIGAERPGLVHISEMTHSYIKTPGDLVKEGDEVDVKVLAVNRQKKQIKLSMKALEEPPVKQPKVKEERPARPGKEQPKSVQEEEGEKEVAVPTAIEFAFREAMERSGDKAEEVPAKPRKPNKGQDEMEKILSRTLENKARTGK